ncbi:MAG: sensor histidine kinase [Bacteroidota bacterium]
MRKEILIHSISWLSFALLIWYWQSNTYEFPGSLAHTARFVSICVLVFYSNLWMLNRFVKKGKLALYVGLVFVLLGGIFYGTQVSNQWMPRPDVSYFNRHGEEPRNPGINRPPRSRRRGREMDLVSRRIIFSAVNTLPMLFFSTLFFLTQERRRQKELDVNRKSEQLESEMKFLKSQINPHFLFNALNNIYSLSITKSEKASELIMKLSKMLRHVIYENGAVVTMEQEIAYIEHYIDFQKLRIGESRNIVFTHQVTNATAKIEPMLLIPFVENAFKHSDFVENEEAVVQISLREEKGILTFMAENTMNSSSETKDEVGGIGINNVEERLKLIYKDRSQMEISQTGKMYKVSLEIIL